MPNKFFNKADKDPLQWSPAPAKNIFLFCEKANPSNRFSVSVQNGAQGPFQPEPFVFFGDSGNTCVLLFGLDSLYAYQPENDLRHSIPLPAFRQKNHSSLLLSTHFDAGKPRLTSKEIFPSGDWSLFLEDGDKLRATLFTTLSEGLKTRTENKDKRAFVSLVLEDAEVIRFEDPGVMEVFLDGVISIFSKPVQSDADRKEAFWKLTSETGKTGFKSMLRNPVCLSGLMWGRPGGTGREKLILTVFETMAGKSQTWVLDVFSSSPAWSALSEENHSALWKTAGRGRDLNVIWRDFFGSSPDDKIYLGLFPDLLDH